MRGRRPAEAYGEGPSNGGWMARRTQESAATHPDEPTDEQVAAAVAAFGMLADQTRLRLLWALRDGGECDVSTLATTVGTSATAVSQHLAKLRMTGLVGHRREGRRVLYRLRTGHVRRLLTEALFQADHQVSGHPDHD